MSTSSQEKVISEGLIEKPKNWWGKRHTFVLLAFFGVANVYSLQVNLTVAIVAMVKNQNSTVPVVTNVSSPIDPSDVKLQDPTVLPTDQCPIPESDGKPPPDGPFAWNQEDQGIILGALFYGYICSQIPSGLFAEKYGGKWIFGSGVAVAGLFTLLTPFIAPLGSYYFIASRVIIGFFEGTTFPSLMSMLALWIPSTERASLGGLAFAGSQAGTFIAYPLCGWLADAYGWEAVFYVTGGIACLWFVFWALLTADSPAAHTSISHDEKAYLDHWIEEKTGSVPFPPLKAIFTTPAFLALIITHFGQNWGLLTLLTEAPTYLSNVQHFSLTANGSLSALPYFCMWLFGMVYGKFTDFLIERKIVSLTAGRKIANTVSFVGQAIGLVGLCFVGCSKTLAVFCLCVAVGINGGIFSAFQVNHMDLSPNFAGTLMGITNTVASSAGFLAPMFVGKITNNNQTIGAWQIVFLVAAGVNVVTNAIFVFWGTAEIQPWNEIKDESNDRKVPISDIIGNHV